MSEPERIIVEDVSGCNGPFAEQDEWKETPPKSRQIKRRIRQHMDQLFELLDRSDERSFDEVEKTLVPRVFVVGRLLLTYFLARRFERCEPRLLRRYRRKYNYWRGQSQPRLIGTFFGKVRYWRTYLREPCGGGFYPLDLVLRMPADGFSVLVMSLSACLATVVSFDRVTAILTRFLFWSPSKTSVEKMVLGFGCYTEAWFQAAPPPEGDGDILVVQIDSKATPTARESELQKRRGKRTTPPVFEDSPRHRGRILRRRRSPKTRRKKGDKSKNGKQATLIVMYTLRATTDSRGRPVLLGPINRWVYASYARKRHAFAIARREADKRGFPKTSKRTVQLVTDGDEDFEQYAKEFFPKARHTLDIMHALEYVWKAGSCFHTEGSQELDDWYDDMKDLVYKGKIRKVLKNLETELASLLNKDRRKRLASTIAYLTKRAHMMNYGWLMREDLEFASGSVEGAVKHVIAKRFDNGSMRWIRERAEALLQLRCIEINGDWDRFIDFVQHQAAERMERTHEPLRLCTTRAGPLPATPVSSDKIAS